LCDFRLLLRGGELRHQAECGGACGGKSAGTDTARQKNRTETFSPKITPKIIHVTPHFEKNCDTGSASSLGVLVFCVMKNVCAIADYFAVNTHILSAKLLLTLACPDVSSHRPSTQNRATPPAEKVRITLLF
jgi:hypothetical protein